MELRHVRRRLRRYQRFWHRQLNQRRGSHPRNHAPFIRAADLDAAYEQVTSAGGKIAKEPYDFPGSFRFCFTTPAGHELGAWTPAAKLTDTRDTVSHARAL
ncbi:VOC family protein [Corynebacterium amycolatum]|uniref:VOC family protein n=1 Tax=Corynebacterium amycolatum TaxID=43765 RepID=UPI00374CA565